MEEHREDDIYFKRRFLNMLNDDILIKYFIDKAKNLSLEYDEQEKIAFELGIGDYFTEDIANEWFTDEVKILNGLAEKKSIGNQAAELYSMIDTNFIEVSLYGKFYEEEIWTLKGLKNHAFWEKQRALAKQIIKELKNSN